MDELAFSRGYFEHCTLKKNKARYLTMERKERKKRETPISTGAQR